MILNLKFVDTSPDKVPLAGVKAHLYRAGYLFVVSESGADGIAVFDIPYGSYKLIVACPTRVGYGVENPYEIVFAETGSTFEIPIELFKHPVATKAGYCRCSGFLECGNGVPAARTSLWFTPIEIPELRYDVGVLNEQFSVETDATGYAEVDLIRGAMYAIRFGGFLNVNWKFYVPDRTWASLPDVLFPVVKRVEFSPPGPLEISVAETVHPSVMVVFRSGLKLSGKRLGESWPVEFVSSDSSVLAVSRCADGSISATGVSKGTAVVSAVACTVDGSVRTLPEPGGIEGSLVVNVR